MPLIVVLPYRGSVTAAHSHEPPSESGSELIFTADEAWFWTPEWQAGEREVDKERAAGVPARELDSGEDFLAYLEAVIEDPSKL